MEHGPSSEWWATPWWGGQAEANRDRTPSLSDKCPCLRAGEGPTGAELDAGNPDGPEPGDLLMIAVVWTVSQMPLGACAWAGRQPCVQTRRKRNRARSTG